MSSSTSYRTAQANSEGYYRDKGSKFLSFLFPLDDEERAKAIIAELRIAHNRARHFCYAFRIGPEPLLEKASDADEPAGSAGLPILNQIRSHQLSNVLIVVVRYFGGTKLGIPGLINAYKEASKMAIENGAVIEKVITERFIVKVNYENEERIYRLMDQLMGAVISREVLEKIMLIVELPVGKSSEFKGLVSQDDSIEYEDM